VERIVKKPFVICECDHTKAQHFVGMGNCHAVHCHCSRFKTRTKQYERMKEMQNALAVGIDTLESWPIGLPVQRTIFTKGDILQVIAQMKKAMGVF
jgi:hypothetical protein